MEVTKAHDGLSSIESRKTQKQKNKKNNKEKCDKIKDKVINFESLKLD